MINFEVQGDFPGRNDVPTDRSDRRRGSRFGEEGQEVGRETLQGDQVGDDALFLEKK